MTAKRTDFGYQEALSTPVPTPAPDSRTALVSDRRAKHLAALQEKGESVLTDKEALALSDHLARNADAPPLSPLTAAQLYALFLNGQTCEEIAELNPGYTLGMVVQARLENDWDIRRKEYTESLMDNVGQRAKQVQLEAVHFIADALSVMHRKHGDKFKKYLQTGDESHLGGHLSFIGSMGIKHYKVLIELLKEATGQTERKTVNGEVLHLHQVDQSGGAPLAVTEDNAEDLLEFLASKKTKGKED